MWWERERESERERARERARARARARERERESERDRETEREERERERETVSHKTIKSPVIARPTCSHEAETTGGRYEPSAADLWSLVSGRCDHRQQVR